jgi:DNA end-binding protein Ku
MARSIWKGSISFGLVNIPVGLYGAEEKSEEIHFKLLDKRSMSPVKYKRVSEKSGREVPWEEIVRGYEYSDGQYVVLSDEDLKRANPEATQTIEILEFVDGDEIDPSLFDKPYYLGPLAKGGKSYALLREALARSGKVGISKVVIRTRQYLAAVIPRDKVLVLELLRFPHELRSADGLELPGKSEVGEKEVQMAERLIEGMVADWQPEKYRDDYHADLRKLIEKRVKAGETESVESEPVPAPTAGAQVIDLMALLKRSVEESGGKGAKRSKEADEKPAARRSPARSTTKKTATAKKPAAKSGSRAGKGAAKSGTRSKAESTRRA